MKKKRVLEADLDSPNAPPRPGSYTAERALALAKRGNQPNTKSADKSRPGNKAATQVVEDLKRQRQAGNKSKRAGSR